MLVLTKRQAESFEALMEKEPKEVIDLIVEYRIVRKWSWSRIKPWHKSGDVDLTPLEWIDNTELIMAVSSREYEIEKDVWEDTKNMGEAVFWLTRGKPIRCVVRRDDKVRTTYNELSDLENMDYVETDDSDWYKWQYLKEK